MLRILLSCITGANANLSLIYWKHFWCCCRWIFQFLLQHGCKIGRGQFTGGQPTFVFPECVKKVMCTIIQEDVRDYEDPVGPHVSWRFWFYMVSMTMQRQDQSLDVRFAYELIQCSNGLTAVQSKRNIFPVNLQTLKIWENVCYNTRLWL